MYKGRKSETNAQFSMEQSTFEYLAHEYQRAKNKKFAYLMNRFQWKYIPGLNKRFPKLNLAPKFPLNIDIEASSACNIKCDHCFRQYMDMKENEHMDVDMYRDIIDECAYYGLFTLKFSMRGEPTLHPELPEMVAYAKEKGIKEVWINSHGGNLKEEYTKRLVQAKPDWITVSFDGLGDMYESIRFPLKYEESLEKVQRLRRFRDQYSPDTFLNTQTVWSAIKEDPDKYYEVMTEIFDRVAYNPDMNFKEIQLVPDPDFVCPRLWHRLAITSKGDFLKCPSDFEKEEVMANFKDKSIKQVWDEEQERNRQMHLMRQKSNSAICTKCHHGAIKKKRTVVVEHQENDGYNYEFNVKFEGVGKNRPEYTGDMSHLKKSNKHKNNKQETADETTQEPNQEPKQYEKVG